MTHDVVVATQRGGHCLGLFLPEPGRSLNITHQERERSGRRYGAGGIKDRRVGGGSNVRVLVQDVGVLVENRPLEDLALGPRIERGSAWTRASISATTWPSSPIAWSGPKSRSRIPLLPRSGFVRLLPKIPLSPRSAYWAAP